MGLMSEYRMKRTLHIGRVESRQKFCAHQPLRLEDCWSASYVKVAELRGAHCKVVGGLRAVHFHRLPTPIDGHTE